jgi:hypothetical protein
MPYPFTGNGFKIKNQYFILLNVDVKCVQGPK